MCDFHLTTDHDGANYPKMARFMQIHLTTEKIEEYVALEDVIEPTIWTSSINFMEYESDGDKVEDINNHSCNVATPNWRQRLEEKWSKGAKDETFDETTKRILSQKNTSEKPSQVKEIDKGKTSPIIKYYFDFIDHCKKTKVQISQLDYLKANPHQLEKLIQCVSKGEGSPKITINHESGVSLKVKDNLEGPMTEK